MIQIDEPKRQAYKDFTTEQRVRELISNTGGQREYTHADGTMAKPVSIRQASP
jgi:hypothetical protein